MSYPPDMKETRSRQTVRGGSSDLDISNDYIVHCIFLLGWLVPVLLQVNGDRASTLVQKSL